MSKKYKKLLPKFWFDPNLIELTPNQRLVFAYCITVIEPVNYTNTGIYEIHRSVFQNIPFCLDLNEVNKIFDFFNKEKPEVMQYDPKNHIIFVGSFYKYNPHYGKCLSPIMEDFEKTFTKAPRFWQEFSERYRKDLSKWFEKLAKNDKLPDSEREEQVIFLERLLSVANEIPDTEIQNAKFEKLKKEEKTKNI